MKKKSIKKADLLKTILEMQEDQFDQFSKENNRELNSLLLWSEGIEYEAKNSFKIAKEIFNQIVEIEELESYCNENPDYLQAHEELALLKHKLNESISDIENKIDSFGQVLKSLEKDIEKHKALSDIYLQKSKSKENQIKNIKQHIFNIMKGLNIEKIEGTFFKASIGKETHSVLINEFTDEELETLPKEYIKISKSLDKTQIKNDLLSGKKLSWASLQTKQNVRIN